MKYVLAMSDVLSVLILVYSGKSQYIQSVYGHFHRKGGSICFAKMAHYLILYYSGPLSRTGRPIRKCKLVPERGYGIVRGTGTDNSASQSQLLD